MDGFVKINIDGKDVGIRFGYDAFKFYVSACLDNDAFSSIDSVAGSAKVIESGHFNECLINGEKATIPYKTFYNWVESKINDDKPEDVAEILRIWAECTTTKKSLERMKEAASDLEKKSLIAV